MSGGYFENEQYKIIEIRKGIKSLIKNNKKEDEFGYRNNFSKETIKEFKRAVKLLRKAYIYTQRIDWLVSGDDSEETFKERLNEDLNEL